MKKFLLFAIFTIFILSGCSNSSSTDIYIKNKESTYSTTANKTTYKKDSNYITIKYRDTLVDVSEFETFNTSKSSFIEKAYYDSINQYLILKLSGTYYHWCDVPQYIRNEFKKADSLGKYYNQYIKGEYDCRLGYIPQYN